MDESLKLDLTFEEFKILLSELAILELLRREKKPFLEGDPWTTLNMKLIEKALVYKKILKEKNHES